MFATNEPRYMDPVRVRKIAQGIETASGVLKAVATVLEVQLTILRTTAFIGAVGGLAIERYVARIKPQIETLARKFDELSQEMENSVRLWEAAQQDG